ncbi:MAG: hypothetical protein EBX72_04055 [Betaproteobacteria bacterium]|nr:hypothetical protein [Betaproteobacteria bacterium]
MLNRLKQFALRLGGVLELTRRISLNLLFLGFVGSALWFAFGQDEASLQEKTVLVISLQGRLVEAAASEDKELLSRCARSTRHHPALDPRGRIQIGRRTLGR